MNLEKVREDLQNSHGPKSQMGFSGTSKEGL